MDPLKKPFIPSLFAKIDGPLVAEMGFARGGSCMDWHHMKQSTIETVVEFHHINRAVTGKPDPHLADKTLAMQSVSQ